MSIEHEQLVIGLLNALGAEMANVRRDLALVDTKMEKSLLWQKRRDKRRERKRKKR